MFIVQQNNQSEESLSTNPIDIVPFDQFPTEGQALSGPFKVPSDVSKKQYFYGNSTKDLVINPHKINVVKQKMNYSDIGNYSTNVNKKEGNEKRKPTVSKNTKPKQQVIKMQCFI